MYKFDYYTEKDAAAIVNFMKENSFAIVTAFGENYPVATHIPLEVTEDEAGRTFLSGHIMKKTDHHKAFEKNENVLVIFNGPHAYISAGWYTTPAIASTWNYMTVHAKGKITLLDDAATYTAIKNITNKYEAPASAAAFDKMSDSYIQQMLKAIIAFKIEVFSLENTFKLSQNRDKQSAQQIIKALQQRGDDNSTMIAAEMMKRV